MLDNLVDKRAYLIVLGCLLQDPSLIDDIDRPLDRTDFDTESFYENVHNRRVELVKSLQFITFMYKAVQL